MRDHTSAQKNIVDRYDVIIDVSPSSCKFHLGEVPVHRLEAYRVSHYGHERGEAGIRLEQDTDIRHIQSVGMEVAKHEATC